MKPVETFYTVILYTDGTMATTTDALEPTFIGQRPANVADIYTTSQQLVKEIDQQSLVSRIVQEIAKANPTPQSVPDRMKDALKSRGIDPESITPAN
jgi:hypothetical protein